MLNSPARPDGGSKKILVIHGPNLNLLGRREPEVYGFTTLTEINQELVHEGKKWSLDVECFQSNAECAIIERIHAVLNDNTQGLIINPAAFTHTSIAIRDALAMTDIPIVEVHLSNIYSREDFRQKSLISAIATGVISGFGPLGYRMALWFMAEQLIDRRKDNVS